MKKTLMLPLAAMISGLLVGCGGGGGGSGSSGGGSTPTDYVSLQFVQKVEDSQVPSGCTIFAEETSSTLYTYAKLASDVRVVAHFADGTLDTDLSYTPSSAGIVKIDKLKLEDGGYISVIDSPSDHDPYYKVLSIQKEYLENQLIQINRNQGNVGCYTAGDSIATTTGRIDVFTTNVFADSYQYLSSKFDSGVTNTNSTFATANTREPVLVKGSLGGDLIGYGYANNIGSVAVDVTLEPLDTTLIWYNDITSGVSPGLDSVKVYLAKENYINLWTKPDVSLEESFKISSLESDWYYVADGEFNNWKFSIADTFESSLNVDIPHSLTITDLTPTVASTSSKGTIVTTGVGSSNELLLRAKYTQVFGSSSETLEHVILAKPNTDGETIVPDLNFDNLSAVNPKTLEVELIEIAGGTEHQIQNIFKQYEESDSVALILEPGDREVSEYLLKTTTHTKVSRGM